ncbi:MAG: 2Fe-2S iron-sulfur cluster binding domain-containing protein, partial [Rhodospirillaceae bacterium]|nr:2Fe-2S iron-sulfur cluster binding domain-containing protein [Rhodospirillaceae bacterium]
MSSKEVYTVRLEPVGIEIEVEEGETVLEAAFRQGIAVPHGCKEGQCASCKSILIDGEIDLKKYSTFALNDMERDQDHILLCRTLAYSDLEIELLNFDEELLAYSIPVREFDAEVAGITPLTHDIRLLEITIDKPLKFWAGQYVDITLPDQAITRSFSMANPPGEAEKLAFIIKRYEGGAFSGQLDGGLRVGTGLKLRGPFGTCFRREGRQGPLILVGGGSGMSPLWSILQDHVASGEERPVRFFYGARSEADLFHLDEIGALGAKLRDFRFIPALSHVGDDATWSGERGFIHDVLRKHIGEFDLDDGG